MDKDIILELLNNVRTSKLIGIVPIEIIESALENGLLERTKFGNFELSDKGAKLLEGNLTPSFQ